MCYIFSYIYLSSCLSYLLNNFSFYSTLSFTFSLKLTLVSFYDLYSQREFIYNTRGCGCLSDSTHRLSVFYDGPADREKEMETLGQARYIYIYCMCLVLSALWLCLCLPQMYTNAVVLSFFAFVCFVDQLLMFVSQRLLSQHMTTWSGAAMMMTSSSESYMMQQTMLLWFSLFSALSFSSFSLPFLLSALSQSCLLPLYIFCNAQLHHVILHVASQARITWRAIHGCHTAARWRALCPKVWELAISLFLFLFLPPFPSLYCYLTLSFSLSTFRFLCLLLWSILFSSRGVIHATSTPESDVPSMHMTVGMEAMWDKGTTLLFGTLLSFL